jgi:type IV pilus biogenesis protein CpaD/CtpE
MLRDNKSKNLLTTALIATVIGAFPVTASAQGNSSPSLIITSGPIPESLRQNIYTKPTEIREITAREILSDSYFDGTTTLISKQIKDLVSQLGIIQSRVTTLTNELNQLQRGNEARSAEYYASVATISSQLQNGTTPGNPRLVGRLKRAQQQLEALGGSLGRLNSLAVNTSAAATEATYLLENTRAAYSVAGAVEEDHVKLSELEDSIQSTLVAVERVLNMVNDDITRTSTYLASERNNLRVLALGVTSGDLYGKSLANRPFSNVNSFNGSVGADDTSNLAASPVADVAPATLSGPRALAKIKFDRPNVEYEQPIYMAVTEALKRYPEAEFDLVAVNPTSGNAAEVAIETTRARRNAEKVLRTLTQMGLDTNRIDLSYNESSTATSSEVHLFVK